MPATEPETHQMSADERKSLTHGEFWIPEAERAVYREALETLNQAGVRYIVSGLYAIHHYTGIYRETKDLDLLVEPRVLLQAATALKAAGFTLKLEEAHWIAKALKGAQIDLIYGMSNGIGFIDSAWYENSQPAILAATPVRVAPPEELIWHRLYIGERHRFDMADVVHLILHLGQDLDWDRLLDRVGEDWRLLASQLHFFDYAYPQHHDRIPRNVREHLLERSNAAAGEPADQAAVPSTRISEEEAAAAGVATNEKGEATGEGDRSSGGAQGRPAELLCRGTMLSRFSFAIDVNEWGFRDARLQRVALIRAEPIVEEIRQAEVWGE